VKDPWEDFLEYMPTSVEIDLGYRDGFSRKENVKILHREDHPGNAAEGAYAVESVASSDLLKHVLEMPVAHQTTVASMRLSTVMKQLGWYRHNNGQVKIGGQWVKGFYRYNFKAE
jgi:hypothetical protein